MGFGWAERRVVRGPQGPPCSSAPAPTACRAGRGLRRRLAPGTLGWVESRRGERWNHLLAAVLFFPPVSSADIVPDGVEDVVASHGLEPPKVQVSSPHPNNRCGIPQNEVDRIAMEDHIARRSSKFGIELHYQQRRC